MIFRYFALREIVSLMCSLFTTFFAVLKCLSLHIPKKVTWMEIVHCNIERICTESVAPGKNGWGAWTNDKNVKMDDPPDKLGKNVESVSLKVAALYAFNLHNVYKVDSVDTRSFPIHFSERVQGRTPFVWFRNLSLLCLNASPWNDHICSLSGTWWYVRFRMCLSLLPPFKLNILNKDQDRFNSPKFIYIFVSKSVEPTYPHIHTALIMKQSFKGAL